MFQDLDPEFARKLRLAQTSVGTTNQQGGGIRARLSSMIGL